MINVIEPVARRIICDESGTVATIDMIHMLSTWKGIRQMMLVGDVRQLANFSAPLDKALRKFGFDSVLMRAAAHPNVGKTMLTEVGRHCTGLAVSDFRFTDLTRPSWKHYPASHTLTTH